jgi:hypothetical protein
MGLKPGKDDGSVDKFLASIADSQRRADCLTLLELFKELTGEPPVLWRDSIVGFGKFHYRGKSCAGEWFHVGFSPRKQNLVINLHCELEKQAALLEKLGKHKIGKACLYLNKLADAHLPTLKKLILKSYKSPSIPGAIIE